MSDTGDKKRQDREPEIIDAEVTEVSPAKDNDSKKSSPPKQPATWPGKVALVLSVVALGGGAYLGWQGWQWRQQNAQVLAQVDQRVDSALNDNRSQLSQEISTLKQQMQSLDSRAAAEKSNVDELQQRLTQSIQQVMSKQQNTRKDWLLAEVEYLMRLANQRVLMEQTPDGALKLLKSADKILSETDDVSIYDVRKALAADIAALEAVPHLDTEGAFLRLGALNAEVNKLRLIPVTDKHELPSLLKDVTPDSVSQSWTQGLKASWNGAMDKLEKLVVIQHRDEPVEPLLSPQQHFFLQQNLHLMLEQAQLALLQHEQDAYNSALDKAEKWTSTYFEAKDPTTHALLQGIGEMKQLDVAPKLPDISGSLKSLKSYLQHMAKLKQEGAA